MTEEERESVQREWKKCMGVARKRERIAREMWAFIADQIPERERREELREGFDLDG